MKSMTRVALYVRTHPQAVPNGAAERIEFLRKVCEDKNRLITDVYYDQGFTGRDLNRPSLQRLLIDANNGLFDEVVITELSQLSRSIFNLLQVHHTLQQNKVNINAISQQFDSSSPMSKFALSMMEAFVELENSDQEERINSHV